MPDCSKGMKGCNASRAGQGLAGGARNNRDRCRNCEVLEARLHEAKQTLREVKRELRRKIRELRTKREKMNLILLTVIDICDQGSPKLNRRAIEEKIKEPGFMRDNFHLANTITALYGRYREEVGDLDSDFSEEEDEE